MNKNENKLKNKNENEKKKPNKIWIELELPTDFSDNSQGEHIAHQASLVLRRMGVDYSQPVFWHTKEQCYCFTIDSGGSYVEAADHGHWYNLDYLAEQALVAEDDVTKAKLKLSRLAPTS